MTDEELQTAIKQRIKYHDNGCWEWIGTYGRKAPIYIDRKKHIAVMPYLWEQTNPGQKCPHMLGFDCDLKQRCVNPGHKNLNPTMPKPDTQKPKRQYQKHTDQCGGIDPVVIERIVSAGTIHAIPEDHTICDCERAYIVKYVDGYNAILSLNSNTIQRLRKLDI